MAMTRVKRPTLNDLELPLGKRTRLQRLMYKYGPANGTLLFLPIDQGLEHGPRDFFVNPPAKDPEFELRIAKEGNFSGLSSRSALPKSICSATRALCRWC